MPDSAETSPQTAVLPAWPDGWYPVATAAELGRKPVRRVLCGVPLVLFRTSDGKAAALHDRCPHRHALLSDGRVVDDAIECPYHGWRFNRTGRCTAIPFHDGEVPQRFVPSVPVEERHGLIFARHGTPAEGIYTPFWRGNERTLRKIIPTVANTSLIDVMENVLDPTHTAFTHKGLMRGLTAKRQPVDFVLSYEDAMLKLELSGEARQDGWISKLTERERTGSTTHVVRPGIVEAVYWRARGVNLVTTVYFSPVTPSQTRGFIVLTTPFSGGIAYLKSMLFLPVFRRIIRQDQDVLGASHANWKAFGSPPPAISPLDFMRPNLEALLAGRPPPCATTSMKYTLMM